MIPSMFRDALPFVFLLVSGQSERPKNNIYPIPRLDHGSIDQLEDETATWNALFLRGNNVKSVLLRPSVESRAGSRRLSI